MHIFWTQLLQDSYTCLKRLPEAKWDSLGTPKAKLPIYVQSNYKSLLITMVTQTSNSQVDAHIELPKLNHTLWVHFSVLASLG